MQLMQTIDAIGPAKLHDGEEARLREAADTLVLAREFDHEVAETLRTVRNLTDRLVDSGRFSEPLGKELVMKVRACGPLPVARSGERELTR